MDKPLKVHLIGTAIKQFPHSIGNLAGLETIDMSVCTVLRDLPSSFLLLPKLVNLKIVGCFQLGESFKRFKESHSISSGCLSLKTVSFKYANLSNEDLHTILENFPKLEDLKVSGNCFISLPKCIKRSFHLKHLDVSFCDSLQEIPELPLSVQKVEARHCWSLTSEASSMLWSKVHEEMGRIEVVMPKSEIPEWFDHDCNEEIPVFWARQKLPVVALAFVFGKPISLLHLQPVRLHLFIEGEEICCKDFHCFSVSEEHVLLCDLRVLFSDEEWQGLDARLGYDWKVIQVQCNTDLILSHWGVYVYKKQTNMEEIKFRLPSPSSSRPYMPSLLAWRGIPQHRARHIDITDLLDDILNMTNTVDEGGFLAELALSFMRAMKGNKASATSYGASLKQLDQGSFSEMVRTFQMAEFVGELTLEAADSAAANEASLRQQDQGSTSTREMQGLLTKFKSREKQIFEATLSDPVTEERNIFVLAWEEFARQKLQVIRNTDLSNKESDTEARYNPLNQILAEERGVVAENSTPLAHQIFEFVPYALLFGLTLCATMLYVNKKKIEETAHTTNANVHKITR